MVKKVNNIKTKSKKVNNTKPKKKCLYLKSSKVVIPPEIEHLAQNLAKNVQEKLIEKYTKTNEYISFPESASLENADYEKLDLEYTKAELMDLSHISMNDLAKQRDKTSNLNYAYSDTISTHLSSNDQLYTGRCWIFAGLNALRHELIKNYNLSPDFNLSAGYLFFYDKLEKANIFMEKMILNRKKDYDNIEIRDLLYYPASDGGWFEWFRNLVIKYGVVPNYAYNECYNSEVSNEINKILRLKLLEFTTKLRTINGENLKTELLKLKADYLQNIYNILRQCLGKPPSVFDWKYYEKQKRCGKSSKLIYRCEENLTPLDFFKNYIDATYNINNKVHLVHDPRQEILLYNKYGRSNDSNMVHGEIVVKIPIKLEEMKEAIMNSIKGDEPCWLSCDVNKNIEFMYNILSVDMFNYKTMFKTTFDLSKEELYRMHINGATHAMLIVGYDKQEKEVMPNKWKLLNSWGYIYSHIENADPGYLNMMDDWFDNHVYGVIIDSKFVNPEIMAKINSNKNIIKVNYSDPLASMPN
jgi:bleomycin hydrolase